MLVNQLACATTQAVPPLLASDPEENFDKFNPGDVVSIKQGDGAAVSSIDFDALMDGKSDSTFGLNLPSTGVASNGRAILQVGDLMLGPWRSRESH